MVHFLYEMCLQGIMVVVFINNFQSKMMNTTTMIPCRQISQRKSAIDGILKSTKF